MARRWLCLILAVLGVFLMVASVRLVLRGQKALSEAQLAESNESFWLAVDGYQQAMRAYLPFTKTSEQGAMGLERLALAAETRLSEASSQESRRYYRTQALEAWRRLRGGIWATRSFLKPFEDRLDRADSRIAELMADEILDSGLQEVIRGRDRTQLVADHRALLARDPSPSSVFALLCFLLLCGWIGSIFALIFKGFDREGHLQHAPFWRCAISALGCFGGWMICLWWS